MRIKDQSMDKTSTFTDFIFTFRKLRRLFVHVYTKKRNCSFVAFMTGGATSCQSLIGSECPGAEQEVTPPASLPVRCPVK